MDNVTFTSDKNYEKVNFSCRISADGERSFFSQNIVFLVDILEEKQILTVATKKDARDDRYSLNVLRATLSTGKTAQGVLPTVFHRIFMANFAKTSNYNVSSSYPKNSTLIIDNLPYDDLLLPPMLIEKQFKIQAKYFSRVKVQKGCPFIYEYTLYGRYKK